MLSGSCIIHSLSLSFSNSLQQFVFRRLPSFRPSLLFSPLLMADDGELRASLLSGGGQRGYVKVAGGARGASSTDSKEVRDMNKCLRSQHPFRLASLASRAPGRGNAARPA